MSNEIIIDLSSDVKIKKTRNKPSKYTEEEKRERHKEAVKKYYEKDEVKDKVLKYYKEKYENMTVEERKNYIDKCMIKYHNMTDEEKKEFLIKCRPYKKKYYHKMKEQNLKNYVVCV